MGFCNFKFLGMKLPCMWSLLKYDFPSKTWANSSPNPCLMWVHYNWYRIKIRYQINTVPTPTVAWTRAWLFQEGGGGLEQSVCHTAHTCNIPPSVASTPLAALASFTFSHPQPLRPLRGMGRAGWVPVGDRLKGSVWRSIAVAVHSNAHTQENILQDNKKAQHASTHTLRDNTLKVWCNATYQSVNPRSNPSFMSLER